MLMKSRSNTLVSIMSVVVCGLIVMHLVSQALRIYVGRARQLGFARQFNLDGENNIPAWYGASMLIFCAILLWLIGVARKREGAPYARHWLALAAICLYLSMDEAASLHEMTEPFGEWLVARAGLPKEYLYYSWVVFGISGVAIVGLLYRRFLRDLPAATRRLFLLAGLLYVGGAIGVELLGARMEYAGAFQSMTYAVLVAVEEGLEMFGIVAFAYALLSYMGRDDMAGSLLRLHGEWAGGSSENPPALAGGSPGAMPSRTGRSQSARET